MAPLKNKFSGPTGTQAGVNTEQSRQLCARTHCGPVERLGDLEVLDPGPGSLQGPYDHVMHSLHFDSLADTLKYSVKGTRPGRTHDQRTVRCAKAVRPSRVSLNLFLSTAHALGHCPCFWDGEGAVL